MSSEGGKLPPDELEKLIQLSRNLSSPKYSKANFPFLAPFDMSQVPDYFEYVDRMLDLQTLHENLEAGMYTTREQVISDCRLIFENCIKYHSTKTQTKWLLKPAKEMLKNLQKEIKLLDKRPSKLLTKPKSSFKLKLPKASGGPKVKKEDVAVPGLPPPGDAAAAMASDAAAAMASDAAATSKPTKPKVSLKLKTGKVKTEKVTAAKAKPTQPKLKLKLSLSKAASTSAPTVKPPRPPDSKEDKPEKEKKTTKIKISGPRGKELPEGVSAPAQKKTKAPKAPKQPGKTAKVTKKKTTATTKKTKKAAATGAVPVIMDSAPVMGAAAMMTPVRKAHCSKVLVGLKRRKHKCINWFLAPISDKAIVADYRAKIKHPVCIASMQNKLDKNEYKTVTEFVLDLRRIFANCLRFNTSIKDHLRPLAVECLAASEDLLIAFLVTGQQTPATELYPPLLYCWKLCVSVLNTLLNLSNPGDGQPTALYFLHPVSVYCGGQFPHDYLPLVKKPMDFGTITSALIEGRYQSVDEFAVDCKLVIENCKTYYGGREEGRIFIEQAERLNTVLTQQLDALYRYTKSGPGIESKAKAAAQALPSAPPLYPKPPVSLLMGVLEDLRASTYTDKGTRITEPAMGPFEKPVVLEDYPDYLQFVQNPMDLEKIERRIKSGYYNTPEDFEADLILVFRNCEAYNTPRKGDHLVAMAKYGAKQFRKFFTLRNRAFEDPNSLATKEEKERSVSPMNLSPNKKVKVEAGAAGQKGKSAPRISLTAAQISSAAEKAAAVAKAAKMPSATTSSTAKNRSDAPKKNQPVPLHIAIAKVKEAFPLRRAHKSLQAWEADCARFYKELMRHPWISAARPKFIFHVPVPILFPELKEAYSMKIRKPMDLTTIECTLLEGNGYTGPEDFLQDIALVFSNSIKFNKAGRDVGDPLSCAYYDASIHLLRYSRWLSLELLSDHIYETDHVDEEEDSNDKLPPFSWKLTTANRTKARAEMDALVLKEPIEKSVEGDRYTWMEAECEKLLKALRHQSDLRYMTFFIQPNYPADYAAFISKPMDWEKVQRTLKNRDYDTFGDIIENLRLIFSNALKYNARLEGTDTVSGRAFESAKYMSAKLEAAINKMMLSVSDRLERERIDHSNAEREIEAAERAEEDRIRASWTKEATTDITSAQPAAEASNKPRLVVRRPMRRRESTDFEIPFFDDEDDGQHERSYFDVVKQQKAIFERQRQDLAKMRQASMSTGASFFARMIQRGSAKAWAASFQKRVETPLANTKNGTTGDNAGDTADAKGASAVLSELEKADRAKFQMKVSSKTVKPKKRKKPMTFSFD